MADTVAISAGSGTAISTEEVTTLNGATVSAQHVQRAGLALITADGTSVDVTSAAPLPVTGTLTGITNALPAGTNVIGGVNPQPATSGGCSIYHKVAAASANAANIKSSAGQVFGIDVFNNTTYPVYVKLHNTSGTPTAGSGVVRTFGVQAGVRGTAVFPLGLAFSAGIGISIVKDIADAGTTAVAASDCVVDIDYK